MSLSKSPTNLYLLSKYEEDIFIATAGMEGAHSKPMGHLCLTTALEYACCCHPQQEGKGSNA